MIDLTTFSYSDQLLEGPTTSSLTAIGMMMMMMMMMMMLVMIMIMMKD